MLSALWLLGSQKFDVPEPRVCYQAQARVQGDQAEAGVRHLRATLTVAGRYALSVSLADPATRVFAPVPAQGFPGALTVVPGPVAGRRTAVCDLPRLVTAGVPAELTVVPADAFGNPGASGGQFAAELAPAGGGGAPVACRVIETAAAGAAAAKLPLPASGGTV